MYVDFQRQSYNILLINYQKWDKKYLEHDKCAFFIFFHINSYIVASVNTTDTSE